MLEQLSRSFPEYAEDISDPFDGLRQKKINCLGLAISACALDLDNILLRHTVALNASGIWSVEFTHFFAVEPTSLLITELTNEPYWLAQRSLDEYGDGMSPYDTCFPEARELIRTITSNGSKSNRENLNLGDVCEVRVVRIDPELALYKLGGEGSLIDLRGEILNADAF